MSKKKFVVAGVLAALSLAAVAIFASPLFTAGDNDRKETPVAAATPEIAEATPEPKNEGVAASVAPEPLSARIAEAERGFRVQLDPSEGVQVVATVRAGGAVVHAVRRYEYGEDAGGQSFVGLEAVVVRPGTREVQAYPLYRVPLVRSIGNEPFVALDDGHVLFVRQTESDNRVVYDLAKLDIGTGEQSTVSDAFWMLDLAKPEQADDFLISSEPLIKGGTGELMMTSFRGRVSFIDVVTGAARSELRSYPAYGDPGSTPPRTLVFPSPDHRRFVYQERYKSSFKVVDADAESVMGAFDYGETKIMDPGIVWSPDSGSFYLEYDAGKGPVEGIVFDNGTYLYARAVDFYDKYGLKLRTIQVPESSDERVNVYGWADGKRVWMEYFRPAKAESGAPLKTDVSYKLYDVSTGQLTSYKTAGSLSELAEPQLVRRHVGYSYYRPTPYLFADADKKLVWPAHAQAQVVTEGEELYAYERAGDVSELFRWDDAKRTFQWLNADAGEVRGDAKDYATPVIVPGEWAVYPRLNSGNIDYVPIPREADAAEPLLPAIPAAFVEPQGASDWWTDGGSAVTRSDAPALRARGATRYGTLELRAEPGEAKRMNGGAAEYHGNYRVSFKDALDKRTELPMLAEQTLWQDREVASMTGYAFDGFDLVLFTPRGYRMGRGYDGGNRTTLAYAVTKDGEAFPLTFVYEMSGAGRRQSASLPIDANVPVGEKDGRLVVRTMAGGSRELALTPDLAAKTLTVTGVTDRSAEYDELLRIANRYSGILEQGLGLEEGDPEARVPEEKLRGYFTDEAWNNPGFKRLRGDFAKNKENGNPSRAFAWAPIDVGFVSPDTIRFTFTLNLWYAIGLAAHLDVALKLENGEWKFHDFGTLETEKLDGLPGYNGLRIPNPLNV